MQLQFFNHDNHQSVICDWQFATGRWRCSLADNKSVVATTRNDLKSELENLGYELLSKEEPCWDEKRRHVRLRSESESDARLSSRRERTPVNLVNSSAGGALVKLPFRLEPGSKVALEIDTANKTLQECTGFVRHVSINEELHHFLLGIKFDTPLSEEQLAW